MAAKRAQRKTQGAWPDEIREAQETLESRSMAEQYGCLATEIAGIHQEAPKEAFQVILDARQIYALRKMRELTGGATQPILRRAIQEVIAKFFEGTSMDMMQRAMQARQRGA